MHIINRLSEMDSQYRVLFEEKELKLLFYYHLLCRLQRFSDLIQLLTDCLMVKQKDSHAVSMPYLPIFIKHLIGLLSFGRGYQR